MVAMDLGRGWSLTSLRLQKVVLSGELDNGRKAMPPIDASDDAGDDALMMSKSPPRCDRPSQTPGECNFNDQRNVI